MGHRFGLGIALLPTWARVLLLVCAWATPGWAADDDPFDVRIHDLPGRIVQAWPLEINPCPENETDLLVLSVEGGPPTQTKRVTWMPCGSAARPGDPAIVSLVMGSEVALVDVAGLPDRKGPQLLRVTAKGIRIDALSPDSADPRLEWAVPGGLPLPERPRQLSRVEIVGDWNATGRPVALVPSLAGGHLVDLGTGAVRTLPMPVYADYLSWEPYLPRTVWSWMISETRWPAIERADDNGDGRLDLFALSRWEIWIYHAGPEGLPSEPSRKLSLVPFDEKTERRFQSTGTSYFARDLDGDGFADLLLSSLGGGLKDGRSKTLVHLNAGAGVSVDGPPDARRETAGGFSGILLRDLDGDGDTEILETTIEFGILAMVGVLLTGSADIQLRVLELDAESEDGTRAIFEDDLSFKIDLGESATEGLVPSLGDYNGDGIEDLMIAKGADAIAFRIGSRPADGPVFGRADHRQSLPLTSGETRVVDLDGDGLDDLVAFHVTDPDTPLTILLNRGRMKGTPPTLRAQE